ncbi:MAG: hypothetical protein K8I82_02705 [Anaerolineae bacterium]|nr:hypothetical protein [Anaerolineae bacterium]
MTQLDFPRPQPPKPNWGVIIVTGIAAALLVIFAGLLFNQISLAFESDARETPSPIPTATLSEPGAAYALQVQHRGEWTMKVTVSAPGYQSRFYTSSGVGTEVSLPYYQASEQETVEVEGEFIVYVTYPVFDGTGRTAVGNRRYGSHEEYITAMNSPHYMLYDENNHLLFLRDERERQLYYSDVPVSVWQP